MKPWRTGCYKLQAFHTPVHTKHSRLCEDARHRSGMVNQHTYMCVCHLCMCMCVCHLKSIDMRQLGHPPTNASTIFNDAWVFLNLCTIPHISCYAVVMKDKPTRVSTAVCNIPKEWVLTGQIPIKLGMVTITGKPDYDGPIIEAKRQ